MAEFLTHHRKKLFIVFLISVLLMVGLCAQLGFLMIARSDHYSKMADELHKRERTIKAARGEIVDAEGRAFTGNTTVCNITIDSNYFSEQELNPLLLELTDLCRDYGCEWRDELPISREEPYTFTGEDENALRALRSKLQLSDAATPEDAMYWLRDLYNLNDYTDTDVLVQS